MSRSRAVSRKKKTQYQQRQSARRKDPYHKKDAERAVQKIERAQKLRSLLFPVDSPPKAVDLDQLLKERQQQMNPTNAKGS